MPVRARCLLLFHGSFAAAGMVLSTSQQVALAFTAVLFTFVVLPRLFGVGGGIAAKETKSDPRYSRKGDEFLFCPVCLFVCFPHQAAAVLSVVARVSDSVASLHHAVALFLSSGQALDVGYRNINLSPKYLILIKCYLL